MNLCLKMKKGSLKGFKCENQQSLIDPRLTSRDISSMSSNQSLQQERSTLFQMNNHLRFVFC